MSDEWVTAACFFLFSVTLAAMFFVNKIYRMK